MKVAQDEDGEAVPTGRKVEDSDRQIGEIDPECTVAGDSPGEGEDAIANEPIAILGPKIE